MQEPNNPPPATTAGKTAEENLFLDGFPTILKPSCAYLQACQSYPCRISELVFGSLLASYILGFVSFASSRVTPDMPFLDALATAATYLGISVIFSFLTAGFYTTYHNSILTMPNVPIADLTNDFSIAISKAVLFGLSMIWPQTYLVWIGFLLLMVFWRQYRKVASLAEWFLGRVKTGKTSSRGDNNSGSIGIFTSAVKKINQQHDQSLDGWVLVSTSHILGAVILVVLGLALAFEVPKHLADKLNWSVKSLHVNAIVYTVAGGYLVWKTQKTLKRKSVALDDSGQPVVRKMDPAARALATELQTRK